MLVEDVVIKTTQPLRVAEATATAPGYGSENLGPVFGELYPRVIAHLERSGARPGLCLAWYDQSDDGVITVHAGFGIDDQKVTDSDLVRVCDLPAVEVASLVFRGSMDNVGPTYEALTRWIDTSGYRITAQSRELYHKWIDDDQSQNITEIQFPIARS
jgi:effector-binding domain-containing protein